jgi:uncharacterized 2Fe-2S/4Fe-4S cluster protein (DUF4445 family)
MSRVQHAATGGASELRKSIRSALGDLISRASSPARAHPPPCAIQKITIVGNTVMHYLFCGIDVEPLSHAPFEPTDLCSRVFAKQDLGWDLPGDPVIEFLPSVGGFVGSDILAGVLATGIHRSERLQGLIDLGTNGEIVFGNRNGLICASTAAGPAFEAGRISMGMRAAAGAISEVWTDDGRLQCRVLGGGTALGICGSGLVDAVAAGLDLGLIQPRGRVRDAREIRLQEPVILTQADVRELQLAKAAIAGGIRLLLAQLGAAAGDVDRVHLAGAFGNYVNRSSAQRIGLLDFPLDTIQPAGNAALLGAKMALFRADVGVALHVMRHIGLASDPRFEDVYVDSMAFPAGLKPAAG